jgi:penicillin-binding protein 1A
VRYSEYSPSYFLEYVRKYLEDEYGVEMIYKGGLEVHTTFNKKIQLAADDALKQGLKSLDKRQGFRGPIGHKEIDVKDELTGDDTNEQIVLKSGDLVTATVLKVSDADATVKAKGYIGKIHAKDSTWIRKVTDAEGNVIKRLKTAGFKSLLKPGDLIEVRVNKMVSDKPVFVLDQEPLVQGAVVAMEPNTGYIRAIVGGYDFSKSEFNRAVFAKRQAGSAFKPVIFAAAMDHNFTPASLILDAPLLYESEEFGDWEPENYDEKYHGPTRLREALIHSRNIVTVKLLEEIGVENAIRFARNIGIKGPFPVNLTLALGSLSISPLEMTAAFCVFANGGNKPEPISIKYIIDTDGNIIENNQPRNTRVIDPRTAYLATSMLEDVVKKGTGWRARALKRSVAGKTGTTNEYRDAWFIGYTPELATSVWVGFDNMRSLGDEETGSRAAAPIWISFMKKALAEISAFDSSGSVKDEKQPFPIPDGIVTGVIDPETGLLATNQTKKMLEFFKEGSVPTVYSSPFYRDLVRRQKNELKEFKKEKEGEEKSLSN